MALPGLIGKKTEKEKFAGAEYTITIELCLPNGRAIQGPDFHFDGQNFAKAYDIKFLDKEGKWKYVYQNTFAITTRMLGVMFAIHSDDKGLVIPPKLVENKIVIVPILFEKDKEKVLKEAKKLEKELSEFNPVLDDREEYKPGWKFNEWELKGVPLRIEIGSRDIAKKEVVLVNRLDGLKKKVKISKLKKEAQKILDWMQEELYKRAEKMLKGNMAKVETFKNLEKEIKNKKIVLAPLCKNSECEDWIKDKTEGAKTLNMPFEQPSLKDKKCIYCGKKADYWAYIGKSY